MNLRAIITAFAAFFLLAATAQDGPKTNFITQATSRLVIPDGEEEEAYWKMQQVFFDKIISKSKLVLHYSIYRHAWGSEGATVVETM